MNEKGIPRSEILKQLTSELSRDFTHESGRILGSMCSKPHNFAKQVYIKNLEKNLGDPGLYPGTLKLEKEAVKILGSLLSDPDAVGNIVSGGTEANITAMWVARNISEMRNEVILPTSAHFSFDKAANLLGLKLIKVRLNEHFQMDVKEVHKAISSKTMAIVGVAGTTGLGVVDPIPELSEIAKEQDIYLHVDAAFGGFVIPFLKELGHKIIDFDFKLPGVCSITVDPHKMGLAPIPAGGILFRDPLMLKVISMKIIYLSGGDVEQSTILGTRSGASSTAVWALLKHLGREGYREIIRRCMEVTVKLAEGIKNIEGISLITQPAMNIVGLKSDGIDIRRIAQELRRREWAVALFQNHIRIIVMPDLKNSHIKELLEDLRQITKELR